MERRYQNPYRHWLSGFAFEIASFLGFMMLLSLVAILTSWLAG